MEPPDQDPSSPPHRTALSRRSGAAPWVLGLLAIVALGLAVLWRTGAFGPGQVAKALVEDAGTLEPASSTDAGPPVDVARGEALLRQSLGGLSSAPEWGRWLAENGLLSRVVAAVDLVASGESPRAVLGFLAPAGHFTADADGGSLHASPASFARYDRIVQVITQVDPQKLAAAYAPLAPSLRAAFKEIAPPGASFDARLQAAIGKLTATPIPEETPLLVDGDHGYTYADPALEALSPAQKHLLRMGPSNARALSAWLGQLGRALPTSP